MAKRYLARKNTSDIRKAVFRFLGHFIVLSGLSFLAIFLFVKSYASQRDNIRKDVVAYKEILNKQQILKAKIDTIYDQMTLLNTGRVRNDVFLGNYISDNIQQTKMLIGSDSTTEFRHYGFLLDKMDAILALKNNIVLISEKEQLALKDLNECMGKMVKVKSEISRDPTRGFQAK